MQRMAKAALMVSGISLASLIGTNAFAAAWYVPNNVRMVQKSNTDTNGRVYGSIQSAINSISNASATNPYVVKIMPGVYNETVTLKPYVSLEGSGRETTVIKANVNNIDFDTCTAGTVLMAANSSIKNLKVVNAAPDAGNSNLAAAVVFNNVEATAEQVNILVGDDAVYSARNNGVCTVGESGHAILNDVNIEIHNQGGDSNAILTVSDGSMTINNSRLIGSTTGGAESNTQVVDCTSAVNWTGTALITNSYIESKVIGSGGEGNHYSGLYLNDCTATVSNTIVMINNAPGDGYGVTAGNLPYTLTNLQVYVPENSTAVGNWAGAPGKIANSMLGGSISDFTDLKLINNFDQNFNPIANQ